MIGSHDAFSLGATKKLLIPKACGRPPLRSTRCKYAVVRKPQRGMRSSANLWHHSQGDSSTTTTCCASSWSSI